MKKQIGIEILCSLLVILFIYTGLSKLLNYADFRFQLGRSPFIQPFAGLVATLLPSVELIIAILIVFKRSRLFGLYSAFFLMLLFSGYVWAMLHFSYYVPCSCGGVLAQLSWNDHLIFNLVFTVLALITILLQSRAIKSQRAIVASGDALS